MALMTWITLLNLTESSLQDHRTVLKGDTRTCIALHRSSFEAEESVSRHRANRFHTMYPNGTLPAGRGQAENQALRVRAAEIRGRLIVCKLPVTVRHKPYSTCLSALKNDESSSWRYQIQAV